MLDHVSAYPSNSSLSCSGTIPVSDANVEAAKINLAASFRFRARYEP